MRRESGDSKTKSAAKMNPRGKPSTARNGRGASSGKSDSAVTNSPKQEDSQFALQEDEFLDRMTQTLDRMIAHSDDFGRKLDRLLAEVKST